MKIDLAAKAPSFIAGALCAVVIGGGGAYAANGGSLLLGKSNVATKVTTLKNTKGTPLALVGKGAPLTVQSRTKVGNLNVDLLDGLDSSQFASAGAQTGSYDSTGYALDLDSDGLTDAIGAQVTCARGSQLTGGGGADFTSTGYPIMSLPDVDGAEAWTYIVGVSESVYESPGDVVATATCWSPKGKPSGSYKAARPVTGERTLALAAKAVAARQ